MYTHGLLTNEVHTNREIESAYEDPSKVDYNVIITPRPEVTTQTHGTNLMRLFCEWC